MTSLLKSLRLGFFVKLVAAVFLLQVAGHAETAKPADPLVGKWYWIEEQVVECFPDGTFTVFPTKRKGKWRAVESKNELLKYEFTWDGGEFVDTLLMSRDKKSLSGKNKDKKKITASRVE